MLTIKMTFIKGNNFVTFIITVSVVALVVFKSVVATGLESFQVKINYCTGVLPIPYMENHTANYSCCGSCGCCSIQVCNKSL